MRIIVIDALANTNVYIEKKRLLTITANGVKNNDGYLRLDDFNNPLISKIDSGYTPLYRVKMYKGKEYLMLYNSTTKQIQLVKTGQLLNMSLDFIKGTQYFLEANKFIVSEHKNNVFTTKLKGYKIFRIFLDNGSEITNYTYNYTTNELTIKGLERNYIDDMSELIIFVYKDTDICPSYSISVERDENVQSPDLKFTQSKLEDTYFVLEYYNYSSIYDYVNFINEEYFLSSNFVGNEFVCFEKLTINETIDKESYRPNFMPCDISRIKRIDVSCELETFNANSLVDMVQYIGKDEFRILLINSLFGRIVLVNNCILDNGISMIFQKEGNMKNCKISCGNYIDIQVSEQSAYSKGKYGKGQYGSGTWVINSHRREV